MLFFSKLHKKKTHASPSSTNPKKFSQTAIWLSVFTLLLLGFFWWLARDKQFDFQRLKEAFANFSPQILCIVGCLVIIQIFLQATRLFFLFPKAVELPWSVCVRVFLTGQFFNGWIPAKVGEVVKVLEFKRNKFSRKSDPEGERAGVPALLASGVLVFEKILDLIALVSLLLAVGIPDLIRLVPKLDLNPAHFVGLFILVMVATAVGVGFYFFRNQAAWLKQVISGFSALREPKRLAIAYICAVLSWALESFQLLILIRNQGGNLTFGECSLILAGLNVGIAVPLTLGNVGTFEATMAFLLGLFGISSFQAIAIGTTHHLFQLLIMSVMAAIVWLWARLKR